MNAMEECRRIRIDMEISPDEFGDTRLSGHYGMVTGVVLVAVPYLFEDYSEGVRHVLDKEAAEIREHRLNLLTWSEDGVEFDHGDYEPSASVSQQILRHTRGYF